LQLEYIKSNELLACFFAGVLMNWNDTIHAEDLHTHFSEGIDNLLDISVFLTLGTILPWSAWTGAESSYPIGKLIGFAALVLLFRRLPSVLVFQRFMPTIRTTKESFFVGWFGPVS
jgi:NhaP-type Na+/H+ or K+/H+ antiporter